MRRLVALALVTLLAGHALAGGGSVRILTDWRSWSWEQTEGGATTDLDQSVARLFWAHALSEALTVELAAGTFTQSWSGFAAEGRAADLNGLLDTQLRLTYSVGERWLLRAGVNGPTGTTSFTAEEFPLAQTVSERILELRGSRLGEGLALDAGAAYSFSLGSAVSVGLGAGYLYKDAFTVIEGTPDYRPGHQISLGGGVDVADESWLWRTNGRMVLYGSDAFDDRDFQQEGPRSEIQTTLLRRWPSTSVWVSALFIHFTTGQVRVGDELVDETRVRRGDELYADLGVRQRLSPKVAASLVLGARSFGASDYDTGEASRLEGTASLLWDPSPTVSIEVEGGYSAGTLDQPALFLGNTGKAELSGPGAGLSLTFRY